MQSETNPDVEVVEGYFDAESFNNTFDELFAAWANEWTTIGNMGVKTGPMFMRSASVDDGHFTSERLAAEVPEDEARLALVNYCAKTLSESIRGGYYKIALDAFEQRSIISLKPDSIFGYEFLRDVVRTTFLELAHKTEK